MKNNSDMKSVFTALFVAVMLCATARVGLSADKYWKPTSGNGWNTGANWAPSGVPGGSDMAIFDGTTNNAGCTIDTDADVAGILMTNSYSGTITQGAGKTVTVGSSHYVQYSGTFAGSDANITINGTFTLAGGFFTAPSGVLTVSGSDSTLTIFTYSSGTFSHGNGTLKFDNPGVFSGYRTHTISLANTLTLNNLIYDSSWGGGQGTYSIDYSLSGNSATFVVTSNFTMQSSARSLGVNGGTIEVQGSITSGSFTTGNSVLKLNGAGNQQYTWNGGEFPYLVVDKSSGTVTPNAGSTTLAMRTFTLTQGAFTAPSGTMTVSGSDSTLTIFTYSGGTFSPNNGTLVFNTPNGLNGTWTHTISLANTLTVNNLTYDSTFGGGQGTWSITYSLSGSSATLVVGSNFTMQANARPVAVNGGTIKVQKDVAIGSGANGGTATLSLTGGNNQTITQTGGTVPAGTWTVNKSGGTATLATALNLAGASQDLIWTNGSLNLGTNMLTVKRNTTIHPGVTNLTVAVSNATACGFLNVVNTLSGITNAALYVDALGADPASVAGQTFLIATNNAALNGQFKSVAFSAGWSGTVTYSAKAVYVSDLRELPNGTIFEFH